MIWAYVLLALVGVAIILLIVTHGGCQVQTPLRLGNISMMERCQ